MTRGVICANSESTVRMGWQAPFNIPNRVRLATVKRSLLLGRVGEWLKPSDCKSDARATLVRIQPLPPNYTYLDRQLSLVVINNHRNHKGEFLWSLF